MALVAPTMSAQLQSLMLSSGCGAQSGPALTGMCDAFATWLTSVLTTQTTLMPVLVAPPGTAGGPVTGTIVIT